MTRVPFAILCALLAGLTALLCVGIATAAPEIPPPGMRYPLLVDVSPSGLQSLWWYEQEPGTGGCAAEWIDRVLEVRRGTLSGTCVEADGITRRTWLIEGRERYVLWAGETLEDTRGRTTFLPWVAR